ncbi:hypothetical protein L3556_03355 [Candidatus Synechococcus calcipolaris G9]|uniref:Uncharacterized protein n=1 Tax=Candidatus Synechococcus calcipolaris G9 TaxID=1497997 RepID=A0ABT6EWW5_9SYNE|nr:hypothetical protein [Candidatus Synechococcus calcipolaris]MDG2989974.1 hypothetical protein [Candidatus Synechococcus calcipolaris G9]
MIIGNKQILISALVGFFLGYGSLALGIMFDRHQWQQLEHASKEINERSSHLALNDREIQVIPAYEANAEILQYAFTDEIIDTEMLYASIMTFDDIQSFNSSIFINVDNFESAYKNLTILNINHRMLDQGKTPLLEIKFSLENQTYYAYAYGEISKHCGDRPVASLIIPGSGLNQSSAIYHQDQENYHYGIIESLDSIDGDTFVFIKPNEDGLAWHNGEYKLNNDFIINYHLNRGSSYSASYIVQSLAIMKYLNECYETTIVAGLSQGGGATLLNALQSRPDIAIVASGHSVLMNQFEWSGHNQIIIPTGVYGRVTDPDLITQKLRVLPTQFLFTYGKDEIGLFKIEAEEEVTCQLLYTLENVTCLIHGDGHIFPQIEIKEFLSQFF